MLLLLGMQILTACGCGYIVDAAVISENKSFMQRKKNKQTSSDCE
jgi:hypothetical protein